MHCNCAEQGRKARFNNLTKTTASRQSGRALEARYFDILRFRVYLRFSHARVLEGVTKSQYPLKAVVFKSEQPCPDTVSLDLGPLLHSGVEQEDVAPCVEGFLKSIFLPLAAYLLDICVHTQQIGDFAYMLHVFSK